MKALSTARAVALSGLEAAREIEQTAETVRVARQALKDRARPGRKRKRARRQLDKLHATLERLQAAVLAEGVGEADLEEIRCRLQPVDGVLDVTLRRQRVLPDDLDAVRALAKATRKQIRLGFLA